MKKSYPKPAPERNPELQKKDANKGSKVIRDNAAPFALIPNLGFRLLISMPRARVIHQVNLPDLDRSLRPRTSTTVAWKSLLIPETQRSRT